MSKARRQNTNPLTANPFRHFLIVAFSGMAFVHGLAAQTLESGDPFDPDGALGGDDLEWVTGGETPWTKTSVVYDAGTSAVASGVIEDNQVSWLETEVTGPGLLVYRWALSSEWGFDELVFSANGVEQSRESGFFPWTNQAFDLSKAETYKLRWSYRTDDSISVGRDQAYLDQVMWAPAGSGVVNLVMTGNGSGTVVSDDGGAQINCGPNCVASLSAGDMITLEATPESGSAFEGWSGACSGTDACTVTVVDGTVIGVAAKFSTASLNEVLSDGVPVIGISGRALSASSFYIDVPSGARDLVIQLSDGLKQSDNSAFLMVAAGHVPTPTNYDCFPLVTNSHQVCAFARPEVGPYYVLVGGQSDSFSGVDLEASYSMAGTNYTITVSRSGNGRVVSSNVEFPVNVIDGPIYTPKVIGGGATTIGRWPWHAQVRASGAFCSGSVINSEWVITAAHCVDGASSANVVIGRTNLSEGGISINASEIIVHEGYVEDSFEKDIALIRLASPINFNSTVQPIELLSAEQEPNLAADGVLASVTGWGLAREGDQPEVLQVADVAMVSTATCRDSEFPAASITDNMICAGFVDGGIDACAGDSGGPLVVRNGQGGYRLAGITSWGQECALAGYPGVYTRVSAFINWIADKTGLTFSDKILDCGDDCQAIVPSGTELTLVPEPDTGHFFVGFDGICAGQLTCTLSMDQARTINAVFQAEAIFQDRFESP